MHQTISFHRAHFKDMCNQKENSKLKLVDLVKPASLEHMPTASLMLSGPPIEPLTRLMTYDSDQWEAFINEWVSHLSEDYLSVQRFTGAGDKGVDIAAFKDRRCLLGDWHNYQCKHYAKPLGPSDAYLEIGKCLWYSFKKHFVPPSRYIFVAPRGASTQLGQLLANEVKLKSGLEKAWEKSVSQKITTTDKVDLVGDFKTFVDRFDFSIFEAASLLEILKVHRETPYFIQRFGGGLPARPKVNPLPEVIELQETVYTGKLFAAYSEHSDTIVKSIEDLKGQSKLRKHFDRSREAFFHSESLRVFVRDKTEPGTFESLQDEICDAVSDICDADHPDGFVRVVAVTDKAQSLKLDAHPLSPSTFPRDLKGICHQLANDDRLDWTNDD
ncbi:ABC-three component system protein [Pseudovibrio denitrificans]|uniref:ABC-three component system protein n=1 Tax=Pseudovibrio denitrificans TaxID=258256 RepID=UPI0039BFB2B6